MLPVNEANLQNIGERRGKGGGGGLPIHLCVTVEPRFNEVQRDWQN